MKTCKKGLHKYDKGLKQCPHCRKESRRKMRRAKGVPVQTPRAPGESRLEQRKRHRDSMNARHPDMQKNAQKKYREGVGLGYAAQVMRIRVGDVPIEILEAKVILIKLKRKLKEGKND